MVRYEFSKDFKTWTSIIANEDIHSHIEEGSYTMRTGFKIGETMLVPTLSFDMVSTPAYRLEVLKYTYCRAYKDDTLTFIGMLSEDFETTIEMIDMVSYTLKYEHLHKLFENVTLGEDIEYTQEDNIRVLDSSDVAHSLVHILVQKLFDANPDFDFTFTSQLELPTVLLYYKASKSDKVIELLRTVLNEQGLVYYLNELQLEAVDAVPTITAGTEIYNIEAKATIQHNEWINRDVAPVRTFHYETKENVVVYDDKVHEWWGGFTKWFWGFNFEGTYTLVIPNLSEDVTVEALEITYVDCDAIYLKGEHWSLSEEKDDDGNIIYRVKVWGGTNMLFGSYSGTLIKATVKYKIRNIVYIGEPNDLEPVDVTTIFDEASAQRLIKAMTLQVAQNSEEWKFYSQVKLNVGDVVRITDLPESTIRINEIEDTDDVFKGYTYHGYPYTEPIYNWTKIDAPEVNLEPEHRYYPVDLTPSDPLQIQDGKFVTPTIRYYINCANAEGHPEVTYNNRSLEVKFDKPETAESPADYAGYTLMYYFDFTYTDISIESYTFVVKWGDAINTKSYIPLVLQDSKILLLSVSTPVFSLKADGTPYANQSSRVSVRKTGITEPTVWHVEGHEIANNTDAIIVTPDWLVDGQLDIRVTAGEYSAEAHIGSIQDGQQGTGPIFVTADVTSYVFPADANGLITAEEYQKFASRITVQKDNKAYTPVSSSAASEWVNESFYITADSDGITNLAVSNSSVTATAISIMAADSAKVTVVAHIKDAFGNITEETLIISLSKARQGSQGTQGPPGAAGEQGPQGESGVSPYTLELSQDNFVFTADAAGNVPANQLTTIASASIYHGQTKEDITTWTLEAIFQPTANFAGSITTDGNISVTTFNARSDIGYITINATKDSITLTKVLRCTKAKQGAEGQPGASGKALSLDATRLFFYLNADGSAKENQTITLNVVKQNITEPVKWSMTNHTIPDGTETYQLTPNDLGLATFKLKNMAIDASTEWSTPSNAYLFYTANYAESKFFNDKEHKIYYRFKYRFVQNTEAPAWVQCYPDGGITPLGSKGYDPSKSNEEQIISGLSLNYISSNANPTAAAKVYAASNSGTYGFTSTCSEFMILELTDDFITLLQNAGYTTTDQIHTWLDENLPFIPSNTEYEISSSIFPTVTEIVTTISADGLSYTLTIGIVKDGQQGIQGPAGTGKTLKLTASSTTLNVDKNGNPLANSNITLNVIKEGITEPIKWTFSTGKVVADDLTEVVLTPADFGYGTGLTAQNLAPQLEINQFTAGEGTTLVKDGVWLKESVAAAGPLSALHYPENLTFTESHKLYLAATIWVEKTCTAYIDVSGTQNTNSSLEGGREYTFSCVVDTTSITSWGPLCIPATEAMAGYFKDLIVLDLTAANWLTQLSSLGYTTNEAIKQLLDSSLQYSETTLSYPPTATMLVQVSAAELVDRLTLTVTMVVSQMVDKMNGMSSTIEQTVNSIAFRVNENGDVVTSAGLVVGVLDGTGYILLDAPMVIASGTITADQVDAGNFLSKSFQLTQNGAIYSTKEDGTPYQKGDIDKDPPVAGFYIDSSGYAEFQNMYARGIFARGTFQADAMETKDGYPAINSASVKAEYQAQWNNIEAVFNQKEVATKKGTSSYTLYVEEIAAPDEDYLDADEYIYGLQTMSISSSTHFAYVWRYNKSQNSWYASPCSKQSVPSGRTFLFGGNDCKHIAVFNNNIYLIGYDGNTQLVQLIAYYPRHGNSLNELTVVARTNVGSAANEAAIVMGNALYFIPPFVGFNMNGVGYANYNVTKTTNGTSFSNVSTARPWNITIDVVQEGYNCEGVVYCDTWDLLICYYVATSNGKMYVTYFADASGGTFQGGKLFDTDANFASGNHGNEMVIWKDNKLVFMLQDRWVWVVVDQYKYNNDPPTMRSRTFNMNGDWILLEIVDGYYWARKVSDNQIYYSEDPGQSGNFNWIGTGIYSLDFRAEAVKYTTEESAMMLYSRSIPDLMYWGYDITPITSFFSNIIPKLNDPSNVPSEPLASLTPVTGTANMYVAAGSEVQEAPLTRLQITGASILAYNNDNELTQLTNDKLYSWKFYMMNLVIAAQDAYLNTKDLRPMTNLTYSLGTSALQYLQAYIQNLFSRNIGSTANRVQEIDATLIDAVTAKIDLLELGDSSTGSEGYTALPNGLMLQWGRFDPEDRNPVGGSGDFIPYMVEFPQAFGTTPYWGFAVQQKSNETRDGNYYGFIYSGNYNPPPGASNHRMTNRHITFSRWNRAKAPNFRYYWMALGHA